MSDFKILKQIDQQCLYSLAGWYKSEFMATNISYQKTKSIHVNVYTLIEGT